MAEATLLSVLTILLGVTVWFCLRPSKHSIPETISLNAMYDYVIVGSGSAGSVIASRLSEDPTTTVLLLEAGPSDEHNELIHTPLMSLQLQRSDLDWSYETTSQKDSLKALKDHISFWPRGRVLGGTSSLNNMAYVRGSRYDYDQWAAEGCEGWGYQDVLPYFIKSDDNRVPWLQGSPYHGTGGPLKVSPGQATDLNKYYGRAMLELGYDIVDCNGESQIGYEPMTLNTIDGTRCSTSRCFLKMASDRPNLHISVNSHVTKVIIKDKSAEGVEFIRGVRKHRVVARREVILSAGSINTPQILMLSGIGPKEHLQSLQEIPSLSHQKFEEILDVSVDSSIQSDPFPGVQFTSDQIPVVADLPVGQNLQDHFFVLLYFYPNVSMTITPEKADTLWSKFVYKTTGKGYLSVSAVEGNAFFSTDDKSRNAYANIQIEFLSAHYPGMEEGSATSKMNCKKETEDVILKLAKRNKNAFMLAPTLMRPKSRGTITLQSTNPFDPPLIDPQYLTEKSDIHELRKGIKKTLELGNTKAFKELGINLEDTHLHFAQCAEHHIHSDAYFECVIRYYGHTVYHPTTTCRMGRENDPTAVVGSDLRVKGISNLRVADASVMRNIVTGNTNAPTIMIGEKAADMIRNVDTVGDIRQKLKVLDSLK